MVGKSEKVGEACCDWHHGHGCCGLLFGLILLVVGVVWLGNDLGWWSVQLPFWPVLVTLIGAFIVLKCLFMKTCR